MYMCWEILLGQFSHGTLVQSSFEFFLSHFSDSAIFVSPPQRIPIEKLLNVQVFGVIMQLYEMMNSV